MGHVVSWSEAAEESGVRTLTCIKSILFCNVHGNGARVCIWRRHQARGYSHSNGNNHNDIMGDGIETRRQKQMCRVLGARGGEKEEERKRKGGSWSEFPGQACEERANCDRGPQNILNVAKGTEDRRRHSYGVSIKQRPEQRRKVETRVRVITFRRGGGKAQRQPNLFVGKVDTRWHQPPSLTREVNNEIVLATPAIPLIVCYSLFILFSEGHVAQHHDWVPDPSNHGKY